MAIPIIAKERPASWIIRPVPLHAVSHAVVVWLSVVAGRWSVVVGARIVRAATIVVWRSERAGDERTGGNTGANTPAPAVVTAAPTTAPAVPAAVPAVVPHIFNIAWCCVLDGERAADRSGRSNACIQRHGNSDYGRRHEFRYRIGHG